MSTFNQPLGQSWENFTTGIRLTGHKWVCIYMYVYRHIKKKFFFMVHLIHIQTMKLRTNIKQPNKVKKGNKRILVCNCFSCVICSVSPHWGLFICVYLCLLQRLLSLHNSWWSTTRFANSKWTITIVKYRLFRFIWCIYKSLMQSTYHLVWLAEEKSKSQNQGSLTWKEEDKIRNIRNGNIS